MQCVVSSGVTLKLASQGNKRRRKAIKSIPGASATVTFDHLQRDPIAGDPAKADENLGPGT